MSVKVTNKTAYPTAEVRRLVKRALGYFDADNVDVVVRPARNPNAIHGRYRPWWYPGRGETRPVMTLYIPHPGVQPAQFHVYERRDNVEPFDLADWREALIAMAAHEAMHHRQRGNRLYREAECDRASYRAVMYYREDTARRKIPA